MNNNFCDGAIGEAHSKLILTGEHAVVYGHPAIAIPFPIKIKAEITKYVGAIHIDSSVFFGDAKDIPLNMMGIWECIKAVLIDINKPIEGLNIKITSQIPLGRGLGSSAAVATAIVRGIYSYYNLDLNKEDLYSFVELAESYAHGKPSGIDMMAVVSNIPIYFNKKNGASHFNQEKPLYLVVADSGVIGDTRNAVKNVKEKFILDSVAIGDVMDQIKNITEEAKEAMMVGDIGKLGALFLENHRLLESIGVSNEKLNSLVKSAVDAGALGAKLTGGGMGGCIIALANQLEDAKYISKRLMKDGAYRTWYFSTDNQHVFTEE